MTAGIAQASQALERRIADFDRRHPQYAPAAIAARSERALDIELDRLERAERARDRWRGLMLSLVALAGPRMRAAWLQRRYAARRRGRRRFVDLWLERRVLGVAR